MSYLAIFCNSNYSIRENLRYQILVPFDSMKSMDASSSHVLNHKHRVKIWRCALITSSDQIGSRKNSLWKLVKSFDWFQWKSFVNMSFSVGMFVNTAQKFWKSFSLFVSHIWHCMINHKIETHMTIWVSKEPHGSTLLNYFFEMILSTPPPLSHFFSIKSFHKSVLYSCL